MNGRKMSALLAKGGMVGGKENVSKVTAADADGDGRLRRLLMLRRELSRPAAAGWTGGGAPIDLVAAWPADRVQVRLEIPRSYPQQTTWPGSGWIDRSAAPRPRFTLSATL